MILYCDTSALVKLYVDEAGSRQVVAAAAAAEAIATCRIAWAELYAATGRRAREVPADEQSIDQARCQFQADWPHYLVLEITQAVVEKAGEYADAFALRGYDAVHLAAASEAAGTTEAAVTFACFDTRLSKAAGLLGMDVLPAPS